LDYFCLGVKHLASGYVRGNTALLNKLVEQSKAWASQLIMAMRDFDEKGQCSVEAQRSQLELLTRFIGERLVQTCRSCGKPLSGNISTIDGVSYHTACVPQE
jgi:hypothetical protein